MLSPITRPPRRMRFRVYDLEWYPHNYEVRLVGTHDGEAYRHYRTVQEFLLGEALTAPNRTVYFAHAGGLADVQFVLCELAAWRDTRLEISAVFSGSSAIIVRVKRGRKTILFCDSYWLLRDKLANIAVGIGREKGGADYHCPGACAHNPDDKCIFYAPHGVLVDYNELDCSILWEAIDRMQEELLDLGGEMRFTIASCAMALFRRVYLKREIETHPHINEIARLAYTASRVEVFAPKCGAALDYDINSSFPFSACKPMPGRLTGRTVGRLPKGQGALYLAECDIKVPDMYLPPLPLRQKGRVYFPTGRWRGWFCEADLETLQEAGGSIDHVYQAHQFEPFHDIAGYMERIYGMRKATTDPFRRTITKLLANSLYGKFAEGELKERVMLSPRSTRCPHNGEHIDARGISQCMTMIAPGIWSVQEQKDIEHEHVPIAVRITALSRGLIWGHARESLRQGQRIYYCDTDSIFTKASLETGPELGQLKLEHRVIEGRFVAPKFYCITCSSDCPCKSPGTAHVRTKGFARLSEAQFKQIASRPSDGLELARMYRLRELWRSGLMHPCERTFVKRLMLDETRPKRCGVGADTRPWTVRELMGG